MGLWGIVLSLRHTLRRASVLFSALLVLCIGVPAWHARAQTNSEYFRGILTTPLSYDPAPIRLAIGNASYDIPLNTLFAVPSKTAKQEAVLLRVLYPEMKGRSPTNKAELDRVGQDSRKLTILIQDHSLLPRPLSSQQYLISAYNVSVGRWEGNGEITHHFENDIDLDRIEVRTKNADLYDVFVLPGEKPEARSLMIQCDRGRGKYMYPNPVCSAYFAYNDLNIKVSYVRAMLPAWKEIRSVVVEWINGCRVK